MTSIETQKGLISSTPLQSATVPELLKDHPRLTDTRDERVSSDAPSNEQKETLIIEVESKIKDTSDRSNCIRKKREDKEEVDGLLENDEKEFDSNIDKVDAENTESLNVTPVAGDNDSKNSKHDSAEEGPTKSGSSSVKRKKRNFVNQETEPSFEENGSRNKRKKRNLNDRFCWRCHKESVEAHCSACPRSWHRRCIGMQQSIIQNWICGECAAILKAENAETRSTAMAQLSVDQLCLLLKHVVERMREYPGSEPFWKPVETSEVPSYLDYVVKPMDLSLLESNVRAKLYGSTDAFMADAKWIQHNCIVFNTCGGVYADTSKLTNAAKQIIKLARQEVSEIEACPDCYAHGRNLPRPQPSWFIEPCRRPHPLVWAKLKGFPFWPAKAMPRRNSQGFVDVRFFGEHDRAWVSPRDLYLYSEEPPVPLPRKRKLDMEECVREITRHCRKLELVFGQFKFAPPKVPYNPHDPTQIKLMLPNYDPLRSNNYVSPQFLIPKKKQLIKKRLHLKTNKTQSDSEKGEVSDSEQKILANDEPNTQLQTNEQRASHKKTEELDRSNNIELLPITDDDSNASTSANHMVNQEDKEWIEMNRDTSLINVRKNTSKKEDVKASTSKIDANENAYAHITIKRNSNESIMSTCSNSSNVIASEPNNNSEKTSNDNAKVAENPSKQLSTTLNKTSMEDQVRTVKQESLLKTTNASNVNKATDVGQSLSNSSRNSIKSSKSAMKVYKPKTRIVDKMNAEKALKSIEIEEKDKRVGTIELTSGAKETSDSKHFNNNNNNNNNSNHNKNNNNNSITSICSMPNKKTERKDRSPDEIDDQSDATLLYLVNNPLSGTTGTMKRPSDVNSSETIEKDRNADLSITNQPPKGSSQTSQTLQTLQTSQTSQTSPHQRKESKARKSFPNKARNCPQLIPHPSVSLISSSSISSNSIDSMVYSVPPVANHTEHSIEYQMLPPEAGPMSARLYYGAQDLAKKMARLMEEAYKEATRENPNCESTASENHQATIHFLRLQIERMRWEHQQQLAELKHNTDKVLREMKAGLEAERLRAIEETRREAEEEKVRCIEEIKRKQWCAMCGREALFYCCWNTAYCDYPCQQSHWPMHMRTCAQNPSFTTIVTSSTANSNQQQQNHNIKVSSSVGRIYALSHNKLNEISGSLSLSYSKEDNGTSS